MLEQTDWKTILLSYTTIFENCRFDRLGATGGSTFGIAEFKTDQHQMKNNSYRSYGTYRHALSCDSSLIKINETHYKEDYIINNFYDSSVINFKYPGIVLNKNYATNGNESSLEDLFCEYGYAYLNAIDMQYKEDKGLHLYFDDDPSIIGAWEYLPIGSTFREEVLDENNTSIWVTQEVEYDGTYVPTSEEIISGKLYLVIKSGSIEPKKIYLNNKYIPSLFLNDDKFPNNENVSDDIYNITNKTSNEDLYIINDQQPLKLCDITLYERVPCAILWNTYFVFNNIQDFLNKLKNSINISNDRILFKCYTWILLDVHGKKEILVSKFGDESYMGFTDPFNIVDNNAIIPFPLNENGTGPISIGLASSGTITVDIYLSVSIILDGFTTEAPETPPVTPPEPEPDIYELNWYKYEEEQQPIVIEYTPLFFRKQEEQLSTILKASLKEVFKQTGSAENGVYAIYEGKLSDGPIPLTYGKPTTNKIAINGVNYKISTDWAYIEVIIAGAKWTDSTNRVGNNEGSYTSEYGGAIFLTNQDEPEYMLNSIKFVTVNNEGGASNIPGGPTCDFYIKFIGITDLSVSEIYGSWSSVSFNSEMYLTATYPTSDLNDELEADINIEWSNGSIDKLKVIIEYQVRS